MVDAIPTFNEVKYVNANGVECSARKTTLENGMEVVCVQRSDLPKGQVEMMSVDTFVKEELVQNPNIPKNVRHQGDTFTKS